jgi:hypothetical protein
MSGSGAIAVGTLPLAILVSPYFLVVQPFAILLLLACVWLLHGPRRDGTLLSEARTPMIQDLLKGLFGPQTAPADLPPPPDALAEPPSAPRIEAPVPAPAPARASEDARLPTVVRPVVLEIEAKIERILGCLRTIDLGDMTAREMTDLRDVHLPALVSSYVDIPADHRARIFQEKGKSASYVLKDSLEVISGRLDATIARLAQREITSFDDANRFIADRYGKREDPFA